jgi:hypothetical protein
MADVQRQFEQFHDAIKLDRFGESRVLREKRDIVRDRLDDELPGVFAAHGETCPDYEFRDQGSYEMGTGAKPLDGDYDIDQGLYFAVPPTEYPDPVVLKTRVHEALDGHTSSVRIRRPCVTVQYRRDGEPLYHVDVAVYSAAPANADGKARLAMGREHSADAFRVWNVSDPEGLTGVIFARFAGDDRKQFRRVVRYLKRWRDQNFSESGHAAPVGIGLTVAAYNRLQVSYSDWVARTPNDLAALRALVGSMLADFAPVWDAQEQAWVDRLTVTLPVEPWSDLFGRMSARQMRNFKDKLTSLRTALDATTVDLDPHDACTRLERAFGDDFPIPTRSATAKIHVPAIASSSSGA